jgi:hypothetical protein
MRSWLYVSILTLSGCVLGRVARPSQGEARDGPPPPPDRPPTAGSGLVRSPAALASAEPPAAIDPERKRVWVRGYWHWDGVRYVWIAGRWEPASPNYTWGNTSGAGRR